MMKQDLTPRAARAVYDMLKVIAFHDRKLPKDITVSVRKLKGDLGGLYWFRNKRIVLCSKLRNMNEVTKVMAHEMCHASLEQNGACSRNENAAHGPDFEELAAIVCERMGWRKSAIL